METPEQRTSVSLDLDVLATVGRFGKQIATFLKKGTSSVLQQLYSNEYFVTIHIIAAPKLGIYTIKTFIDTALRMLELHLTIEFCNWLACDQLCHCRKNS